MGNRDGFCYSFFRVKIKKFKTQEYILKIITQTFSL